MTTTIILKEILTNDNLKAFFKHYFNFFSHYFKSFLHFIKTILLANKNCREFSFAKLLFLVLHALIISIDLSQHVNLNFVLLAEKFMLKK